MKNFIQPGRMVTAVAPSGGVVSGNAYLIGSLFGVAATTQDQGAEVEIATDGVFELPKTTSQAWAAAFAAIYWDNSTKKLTTTSSGNTKVGINMKVEASDAAIARVRLNGTF
jgi:predicted RecA/RadA family phage recombinase